MNTCNCPNPPGGDVTCETSQLAMCSVSGGQVHGSCHTPQPELGNLANRQLAIMNWALSIVTGLPRSPQQVLSAADDRVIQQGRYERRDGTIISFQLPAVRGGGAGHAG